jgi:hypothetical protein
MIPVSGIQGTEASVNKERIRELEEKITDLKHRWPAHSVPPHMWQELLTLEDELEAAKKGNSLDKHNVRE